MLSSSDCSYHTLRCRTYIRFEPDLYRTIRSGEGRVIPPLYIPQTSDSVIGPILNKPRIQVFGHLVQNVLLQKRTSTEIASVLECCPNVSNLALWIIQGTCTHLIPIIEKMPLRKFSFDPSYFFENYASDLSIPFNQPIFLRLTHLEIINATSSWSKWRQLALLPNLTHLAVAGMVNQQLINHVLEECKALELFIMFYLTMGFLVGELTFPQQDDRVVLLKSVEDHLDHWEKGARGEEDFWMTAQLQKEEAIRAKKCRASLELDNKGLFPYPNPPTHSV